MVWGYYLLFIFFNSNWVGDWTFFKTIFQKLGSFIFNWLSALSLTNLLLENEHEPLIREYFAILELFWMISSTFCSKNVSLSLCSGFYKKPNIPFFSKVSISAFVSLFSFVFYPVSLKCPPIKIALSSPNFWVALSNISVSYVLHVINR